MFEFGSILEFLQENPNWINLMMFLLVFVESLIILGLFTPATLIIPRITKAGLMLGGAYGEGVLRINEAPVDYYSLASASYGLQIGAQQYSNIIFFMTEEALQKFRVTDGWELGADAEVVFRDKGYSIGVSSKTISKPVYAVVFDQKGLLAGTSLVGAKYSRLIR